MAYALCTVTLDLPEPGIADAAASLDVAPESIDADFGVIPIDPRAHTYAVRVDEQAIGGKAGIDQFSDPKIEPFGP